MAERAPSTIGIILAAAILLGPVVFALQLLGLLPNWTAIALGGVAVACAFLLVARSVAKALPRRR